MYTACSNIITILYRNDKWYLELNKEYLKLINFYDNFFIPISSDIVRDDSKMFRINKNIKTDNLKLPFSSKLITKNKLTP